MKESLTFHKCQIVMKAILSFLIFLLIFWLFFLLFFFFIFALTFQKCQIVMRTGCSLQRPEKLVTANGGQITGAGKAYDSGRGADYSGRGSL